MITLLIVLIIHLQVLVNYFDSCTRTTYCVMGEEPRLQSYSEGMWVIDMSFFANGEHVVYYYKELPWFLKN